MLFRKKYHYVCQCPRCNSFQTGYVTRARSEDLCNKLMYEGLLNGELVEAELGFGNFDIDNNLFCRNCDARWYGEIEIRFLTLEERVEQKELRGITEELINEYSVLTLNKFERKQAMKILNKEKNKILKEQEKRAVKESKEIKVKVKK